MENKDPKRIKVTTVNVSYYVKLLSVVLFLVLGGGAIAGGTGLVNFSSYNQGLAGKTANTVSVYAYSSTSSSMSPAISIRFRKRSSNSDIFIGTKPISNSSNYVEYKFDVTDGIYPGDVVYVDYDNDTRNSGEGKLICESDRSLYVQKIIIGSKVYYLDTRSEGTEIIDPSLDLKAKSDSNPNTKKVAYDRGNTECGDVYVIDKQRYDFGTLRDFERVNGKQTAGILYYGDPMWLNGPPFRGQMLWNGSIRIEVL